MDKKEQFENWLEDTKSLSIKSCKNYSGAVTKISKDLIESGETRHSLYDITDHSELVKLSNIYWTPAMIKKDKEDWKSMYGIGLRHYIEFCESIHSGIKITAVKDRVIHEVELSTNLNKPSIVSRGQYVRTQPEEKLVDDFCSWLAKKNIQPGRLRFGALENDIYMSDIGYLIEAKGDIKRSSIRMGLGQVIDYSDLAKQSNETIQFKGLLLPEKPDDSIINLLKFVDIKTIWQEDDNFICSEKWII